MNQFKIFGDWGLGIGDWGLGIGDFSPCLPCSPCPLLPAPFPSASRMGSVELS